MEATAKEYLKKIHIDDRVLNREDLQEYWKSASALMEEYAALKAIKNDAQLSNEEYWKQRCLLAEKCLEESPCDPDMTRDQIKAHSEYNDFIKLYGKQ